MGTSAWQKSSYCGEGESCVHVAGDHGTVLVRESADPTGATLRTTPHAWAALLLSVKAGRSRD
ncbi:DUF397 domain-containing protein [Streptomyces sp. NRRL WC-3549]|uniref:DUF397 domain-containing protein n=1 Tax=Streptomyces sp. NRRL WC-3549 TaxID=1463925 RepID=UPI0004C8E3AB|nr:DUF397 domain-containing protein [Streptomyces sp. NRRL WC-3549]